MSAARIWTLNQRRCTTGGCSMHGCGIRGSRTSGQPGQREPGRCPAAGVPVPSQTKTVDKERPLTDHTSGTATWQMHAECMPIVRRVSEALVGALFCMQACALFLLASLCTHCAPCTEREVGETRTHPGFFPHPSSPPLSPIHASFIDSFHRPRHSGGLLTMAQRGCSLIEQRCRSCRQLSQSHRGLSPPTLA